MNPYPCKCKETGRACGGRAASLDHVAPDTLRDPCPPTARCDELAGVLPVARDERA